MTKPVTKPVRIKKIGIESTMPLTQPAIIHPFVLLVNALTMHTTAKTKRPRNMARPKSTPTADPMISGEDCANSMFMCAFVLIKAAAMRLYIYVDPDRDVVG